MGVLDGVAAAADPRASKLPMSSGSWPAAALTRRVPASQSLTDLIRRQHR
ncbi:hypothetical protein [Streptomyces sp. NPDC059762]